MKSFDSKATGSFHQSFPGGQADNSFDFRESVVGPVLKLTDLVAAAGNPIPYSDAAQKRQREEDEITTSSYMPSFRDMSGRENKSPLVSFRH